MTARGGRGWGLLLVVLAWATVARAADGSMPQALGQVPEFALVDEQGRPVSHADLDGKVWVADFIFTRCAGQCPLMSSQMAKLQARFDGVETVQFVSFTVDPSYDTPQILAAYAKRYGAPVAQWRFVTGDQDALWTLARTGFRLGVGEDGTAEEPITHSVRLVLVDQQRRIRGYYDATDAGAMERLFHDVHTLLRNPPDQLTL